MLLHTLFDVLAALSSLTVTVIAYRWRLAGAAAKIEQGGLGYIIALVAGAGIGGFGFGTLNLWLSDEPGLARSILGALAGAIASIEVFKRWHGVTGSTGLIFVPAFATTVTVGRWGCYFAGLEDKTYGTPTALPWGKDFGDGVLRHPVQLYESVTMLAFLAVALILIGRRQTWFMRNGFYALVLAYAGQRFLWEFLKPYGPVIGPFNVFHLVCTALIAYATWMIRRSHERASP
jgi:phosphatidylglycerol---prolipoprotein diacylglyceryl transferase